MKPFPFALVIAVVAASLAAPFIVRHMGQLDLRAAEKQMREQTDALAQLTAKNERQINVAVRTTNASLIPREQIRELSKLRSEVGRLKATVAEMDRLRGANQKLVDVKAARLAAHPPTPPEALSGPNYWPKDQLAFSGYGTPDATLQTAFWAMTKGDIEAMLSCVAPEVLPMFEKERVKDGRPKTDGSPEFKEMASMLTSGSTGFRVVGETAKSPDEMVVNISFEGEGVARKFILKRSNNDWKIASMLVAGQDEPGN